MSWQRLPTQVREAAERALTPKQLVTYKLNANGLSERQIAIHLKISRRAVRDRLAEADVKIQVALEEAA
jgi:DNA-binding CsgD family transcriptional regulator